MMIAFCFFIVRKHFLKTSETKQKTIFQVLARGVQYKRQDIKGCIKKEQGRKEQWVY